MSKTWNLFNLLQNNHSFDIFFVCLFVFFCSAIVENMAEFRPGLCSEAAQQGLMQWLLKRIKVMKPTVKQEALKFQHFSKVCRRSASFCSKTADEDYF